MTVAEFLKELSQLEYRWVRTPGFRGTLIRTKIGNKLICPVCAVASKILGVDPGLYANQAFEAGRKIGLSSDNISILVNASDGTFNIGRHYPDQIKELRQKIIQSLKNPPKS